MTNGVIQGTNAALFIYKNDWVPFLCLTDIGISVSADILQTGTPGSGHWGKNAYQKLNYTITTSGALLYNQTTDTNFSGMDALTNMLNFASVKFRIAYTDDQGDIQSVQGFGIITGVTWAASVGAIVKDDVSILGDGELKFFQGLIPCDSTIIAITVTGQTAADGIAHVTYTYTGAPYQVKWRVDGVGKYIYTVVGITIDIPGLSVGSHSIEIVPVCLNGYESDNSASTIFSVTQALTCSAVCVGINTGGGYFNPIFTGTPAQYKYNIDGGAYTYVGAFIANVSIAGLPVGSHTLNVVPVCANGAEGTGFTKAFTITSNPSQSVVNYNFATFSGGNIFQIYVNGSLVQSLTTAGSGSLITPVGATVRGVLQAMTPVGSHGQLQTQDTTLLSVLDNRTGTANTVLQYIFNTNGDTYFIQGTITP